MNDVSVHARKRRKNLAVLLAVLGWCALIFFVSMARMAHGDEANKNVPPAAFATTRAAHQKKMDDQAKQYHDEGAQWRDKISGRAADWGKEWPPKTLPP